ncbi:two-component sensor histidine kinase [Flavobacterium galactosidilyticum]|uniref:sensor histidine kinase n=1 Tax=Flavobacterium galactosidilyticum TaxID=2893886 RepID=UPI001E495B6E|nr:ATP-binding protein [Flavobacterium sp. F-340]UFH45239.1 two-component sensor histidine kinase [Flavobacterium sp. F-340]
MSKKISGEEESDNAYSNTLLLANKNLELQIIEIKKLENQLSKANAELIFQNKENKILVAELIIANQELIYQNQEKEKRAEELIVANTELKFQNEEKENRAAELIIANQELAFQNQEKQKRADELIVANTELEFQNQEKENRAAELIIANQELAFQNQEKQNRANELVIANQELEFQNKEKEKRANELLIANKEIESFTYISSHDLQEPLRKIQSFSGRIFVEEYDNLSAMGKYYVERTKLSALHMQTLINDLLAYSRTNTTQRKFVNSDLNQVVKEALEMLKEEVQDRDAIIEIQNLCEVNIIPFQFRQLIQNLVSNSLKFSIPGQKPHITISCDFIKYDESSSIDFNLNTDHHHISIIDNGIGFEPQYKDKIFDIFQRLNDRKEYSGTGIGLTIARKIVENHNGIITGTGKLNHGAQFDIYLPCEQ